ESSTTQSTPPNLVTFLGRPFRSSTTDHYLKMAQPQHGCQSRLMSGSVTLSKSSKANLATQTSRVRWNMLRSRFMAPMT
ncbi:hypothetical protein H0H81_002796, partial [Sphagnurus paluster]